MKKRFYLFFFLLTTIFLITLTSIGCFYDHNHSILDQNQIETNKTLIKNREISSNTNFNQNFGEMTLEINQDSCEEGLISISQTPIKTSSEIIDLRNIIKQPTNPLFRSSRASISNLTDEYDEVSANYYTIELLNKKQNPMLLANPAKITFNYNNDYPQNKFYIAKRSNNKWYLQKPIQYNKTSLSFQTFSFSDWLLLKEKNFSNIEKAPSITASSTLTTNGKNGNFKSNLEIKVSAPYNALGKYILKILGRNNFPLIYDSKTLTASSSYEINLSSLSQPEITAELATYTITLNMKDYNLSDVPEFIVLIAEYTDLEKDQCFISQKRIAFLEGVEEKEENKKEDLAPYVFKSTPNNNTGTEIIPIQSKIVIEFSQEMDINSVESALSLSPEVDDNIIKSWSSNNKILTLDCTFESFQTYTLKINNKAKSKKDISLENDFVLIFGTPKPNSHTDSETNTNTTTNTQSKTQTQTQTQTQTNTNSNTSSDTQSQTDTNTNTDTNTQSDTNSNTNTNTDTQTQSDTNTQTNTNSNTNSNTQTQSDTNSNTNSNTDTQTQSDTNTQTNTNSNTNSNTDTQTQSDTNTQTNTNSNTNSNTDTQTQSDTNTQTNTNSNTNTNTQTETNTQTQTQTQTQTNSNTNSDTQTQTQTQTQTGTNTDIPVAIPPEVLNATPIDYSENISLNQRITITFSKNMNQSSVTNAISVTPALSNGYSTNWSDSKTLIISANESWKPDTSYRVSINSNAEDFENQKLSNTFTLRFKTLSSPLITSISPSNQATDIALNSHIEITFSKSMNTTKTQSAIEVNPSSNLSFEWENSNKKLRIINSTNWPENTYIRASIKDKAIDTDSIAISNPQIISFRTLLYPAVVLNSCHPAPNSESVATNTAITVLFNKNVDKSSAESAFSLKINNINTSVAGNFTWNGKEMIFKPQSPLSYRTRYNVNIEANYFDSNNSNPITNTTWSFTTEDNEGSHSSLLHSQNMDDTTLTPRTEHSMVVFNNNLWIIGGKDYTGSPLSDICKSSDGINWTKVKSNAAFGPRFGHSCTVHGNKIWLSGGITIDDESGVTYLNDVWNSSDGISWTRIIVSQETSNYEDETLFSRRAYHNMLSYKGQLWVMLGEDQNGLIGDIWSSTDGITWIDRSKIDIPRKKASAVVFKDIEDNNYESIFVIGGYGKNSENQEVALNELVFFKDKNTNWFKKSVNLDISPLFGSAATVYNNRIWLISGQKDITNNQYLSEIMISNNGKDWIKTPLPNDFEARTNHQAAIFNSKIVISGGENSDNTFNEVWSIK